MAENRKNAAEIPEESRLTNTADLAAESQPLLDGSTRVRTPLDGKKTYKKEETVKQLKAQQPKKKPQRKTSAKAAKPARPQKRYGPLTMAYRFCYYLGIQVMRMFKRWGRSLRRLRSDLKSMRIQISSNRSYRRRRRIGRIQRSFTTPFREMSVRYRNLSNHYQEKHKGRRPGAVVSFWFMLSSCRAAFSLVTSYVLPLVALAILLATIQHYSSTTFGLAVEYEGEDLGVISHEAVFNEAQISMKERIVSDQNVRNKNTVPTYTLTAAHEDDLTDVETLSNRLITASGGTLEEASGFYLDGRFMGAVKNGNKLLDYLVNILERDRTGAEDETVSFIKSMALKEGLYPSSSVIPMHKLAERISGNEQVEKVYIIESGDTPIGVASKNDMPYAELKALNPEIETAAFFRVGNEVLISRAESYLATKVTRTEVYEEDIPFGVDSIPDDRYPQGYTVTVSNGIPGKQTVTANVTYIDGIEESRTVLKTVVTKDPTNKVVRAGTMTPQQYVAGLDQSGSGFIWPVDWGFFNGSLGSYWGHTGMDISGNYGAPIRASRSGTVVRSAWYGPYGMHVIIDHGSGVTTLYAHMSQKYVTVGQYVVQGEMIGLVGRTGNVTGPHLHFEVRINGRFMDPVKYVGTYKK